MYCMRNEKVVIIPVLLLFPILDLTITVKTKSLSRVNVYLTFRMLLYFRISNSVMLSSDNENILIIGFSFQGTVLNVFF